MSDPITLNAYELGKVPGFVLTYHPSALSDLLRTSFVCLLLLLASAESKGLIPRGQFLRMSVAGCLTLRTLQRRLEGGGGKGRQVRVGRREGGQATSEL